MPDIIQTHLLSWVIFLPLIGAVILMTPLFKRVPDEVDPHDHQGDEEPRQPKSGAANSVRTAVSNSAPATIESTSPATIESTSPASIHCTSTRASFGECTDAEYKPGMKMPVLINNFSSIIR